jgi:hypothetical protein
MGIPERQPALAKRLSSVGFVRVEVEENIYSAENQIGE